MRKATAISMGIVVMSLVGMMFAANMALKPYQQYAAIGKDLTNIFEMRSDIREGSKVFTLAKGGSEKRLSSEGWGLLIEMAPSERVKKRKGSLEKLAYRAAREAADLYDRNPGKPLEWIEIEFELAQEVERRTLIRVDPDGRLGRLEPKLPVTWPETTRPGSSPRPKPPQKAGSTQPARPATR